MKKIKVNTALLLMIISVLLIQACKKDDPIPETERVKDLLKANTWKIQSVTVNNTNQDELFTGLTLSFTENSYSTTNGGVVWPSSGNWQFTDATAMKIKRSDNMELIIEEISTTSLELSLTWVSGSIGQGKVESVAGKHIFKFVK